MLALAPPAPLAFDVAHLPPSFSSLEEALPQMEAGAPGKVGTLRLRFERRAEKTRLTELYSTGPQRVNQAMYLDEALPDMAVVFIQSVGGGILQGDRLAIEISLGPGARAHVTTQSATKLYRMERNYATQRLDVKIARGAYLELMTDFIIPYEGARFYSEIDLAVASDATMIYSDAMAPGRVAFGESFAYELLHTRLRAHGLEGDLRFADTTILAPRSTELGRPGMLGTHTDLGSLYVLTRDVPSPELAEAMRDSTEMLPGIDACASTLPHGDGAFTRVLGGSSRAVQGAIHAAWRSSRMAILGIDIPKIHRIKYGVDPFPPNNPRREEA
jgi:urease accessory protein